MSREYLAMFRQASEGCPAPWRREKTNAEKRERARQMRAARSK